MTSVAQYYAEVGVGIDRSSLRGVDAYLKSIERKMINFKRRLEGSQMAIKPRINTAVFTRNLRNSARSVSRQVVVPLTRFEVNKKGLSRALSRAVLDSNPLKTNSLGGISATADSAKMLASLQRASNRVSKTLVVPITRFKVNEDGLRRAINRSMMAGATRNSASNRLAVSFNARISANSIAAMRNQVRNALEGITIRPRINPRVPSSVDVGTRNSGAGSRSRSSGNPMLLGGAAGAFMRFGVYSLPFIGGAMGLNTLSNTLREFRAQETGLEFAASMATDPSKDVKYFREYLDQVGDVTGIKESLLSRDFHQMLAGSAGTPMEEHLEEGFLGLTQYAAILGLSDENMRLVMRGSDAPCSGDITLKTS